MTQQDHSEPLPSPDHDRSKLGVITDPTIKLKAGPRLQEYIRQKKLKDLNFNEPLTIKQIKSLLSSVNEDRKSGNVGGQPNLKPLSLSELLMDAEVIIPELEVPPRNLQLEARVSKLKFDLARKEYNRMTRNVTNSPRFTPEDSIGTELRKMNQGLLAVCQFVVTVCAAFAFGFLGVEVTLGYPLELAYKLLLGITFSLIVGIAELYFLILNVDHTELDDEAEQYERSTHNYSSMSKTQIKQMAKQKKEN